VSLATAAAVLVALRAPDRSSTASLDAEPVVEADARRAPIAPEQLQAAWQ
jgi:hypothetical protein